MDIKNLTRIDAILGRINTHPEYSKCVGREVYGVIREEAQRHSHLIEFGGENRRMPRREREDVKNHLGAAWSLLSETGITLGTMAALGQAVEPENHPYKNFRSTDVLFGPFVGSNPEKIPFEVNTLVEKLNEPGLHPILRATEAHVETVRIHPYVDGNGRAARLLQNFVLQQRDYPAAIIPVEDRDLYLRIMGGVLRDRAAGKSNIYDPSENESIFIEYVASKVLDSVNQVEEELRKNRRYQVSLQGITDKSAVIRCGNSLRDYSRRTGSEGVKVSLNTKNGKKKSATLNVEGDISLADLTRNLERTASRCGNFKFDVTIE